MQNPLHSNGIFVIEQIVTVQLKANEGVGILFFQSSVLCGNSAIQHRKLTLSFLSGSTPFLFLICQIAVGLNHQVDIPLNLRPAQCGFLMFRVMVKFQTFAIVVHKSAAAIQIIVGMPADAVLLCKCFGTELSVGLNLIQLSDSLLTVLIAGAMPAQLVFDFRLRQNKSGGRFFVLRSVDHFDLLGFGGDIGVEETQL